MLSTSGRGERSVRPVMEIMNTPDTTGWRTRGITSCWPVRLATERRAPNSLSSVPTYVLAPTTMIWAMKHRCWSTPRWTTPEITYASETTLRTLWTEQGKCTINELQVHRDELFELRLFHIRIYKCLKTMLLSQSTPPQHAVDMLTAAMQGQAQFSSMMIDLFESADPLPDCIEQSGN